MKESPIKVPIFLKSLMIGLLLITSSHKLYSNDLTLGSDRYRYSPFLQTWDMYYSTYGNLFGGNTNYAQFSQIYSTYGYLNLKNDSTSYIQNRITLQQGSTFYVSSGTVNKFTTQESTSNIFTSRLIRVDSMTEITTGFGVNVDRFSNNYAGVEGDVPSITDNGDGTITVGSCKVIIYNNSNFTNGYWFKSVPQKILTPTNNEVSYVVVNWNSGTPEYQIVTLANRTTINQSNIIPVYRIFQVGNFLEYYIDYGNLAKGLPNKEVDRIIRLRGIERESGFGITEFSSGATIPRHVKVEFGVLWFGLDRSTEVEFHSSNTATCPMALWMKRGTEWYSVLTSTYNNLWYQGATSTATVGVSKIVTNWIYRRLGGCEVDIILGNDSGNSLAQALNSIEPSSKPPHLQYFYKLIGRIFVVAGADTASQIQQITDISLTASANTDHTQLTNIGVNTHAQIDSKISALETSTQTLLNLINQKVSTFGVYNNSSLIGGASNFNFINATALTITAGTATITLPTGGGSSYSPTTNTKLMQGGSGDIFMSTIGFNAGVTNPYSEAHSTAHLVSCRFHIQNTSTGTAKFALAYSTGGSNSAVFSSYLCEMTIGAGLSKSSETVLVGTTLNPEQLLTIHTMSVPALGTSPYPSGFYATLERWLEDRK